MTANSSQDPPFKPQLNELPYDCYICGEGSKEICVYCTKDCCELHRCERCLRCSDCCLCHLEQRKLA